MLKQGFCIPEHLLVSALYREGCDLDICRLVHYSLCISSPGHARICGSLIRLFADFRNLLEASLVFCQVTAPTVHTWQAIIYAHLVNGKNASAIEAYQNMSDAEILPNRFVLSSVLRACSHIAGGLEGMFVHEHIITHGLDEDVVLGSALVDMYAKCGNMGNARWVFNDLHSNNIVLWNALICGYVRNEENNIALELFQAAEENVDIVPTKVTYLSAIKACGEMGNVKQGHIVHQTIVKMGHDMDAKVANTLIDMYAKCYCMKEALNVLNSMALRNVVSWSAIIAGAIRCDNRSLFSFLYNQMICEGIVPDRVILIGLLNACAHAKNIEHGVHIHDHILKEDFGEDSVIRGALIDMYAKCGELNDARRMFDEAQHQTLMLWGLMITGYAQHGEGNRALEMYAKMQESSIKADKVLFSILLNVCGELGAMDQGKALHEQINEHGIKLDMTMGYSLIGMYSKCGDPEKACEVMNGLLCQDSNFFGTMMTSHMLNAKVISLTDVYSNERGRYTDCFRYTSRWSAIAEVKSHFYSSNMKLCTSIIGILGSSGHFETAINMLQTMPILPNDINWISLLSRCPGYGHLALAERCIIKMMQMHYYYGSNLKLPGTSDLHGAHPWTCALESSASVSNCKTEGDSSLLQTVNCYPLSHDHKMEQTVQKPTCIVPNYDSRVEMTSRKNCRFIHFSQHNVFYHYAVFNLPDDESKVDSRKRTLYTEMKLNTLCAYWFMKHVELLTDEHSKLVVTPTVATYK
ncbi:hypothetical protein KP509_24G055600 [Ceratopteris richardii]|uniref:Pentatricopeptide repeat-containing protein n=1 Tax=Ceratopteris richardii TaxID=49495 RepID=A0A8T2RUU7_CERRI|nr:hypothetical protein KP509_24G055600 [Ceratopteris richardii]